MYIFIYIHIHVHIYSILSLFAVVGWSLHDVVSREGGDGFVSLLDQYAIGFTVFVPTDTAVQVAYAYYLYIHHTTYIYMNTYIFL